MSLIDRIGPDTISKLERAAVRRFDEANLLADQGCYLTSIYLQGYVAEMIIGSAYFRVLGSRPLEEISPDRLRRVLIRARQESTMVDKSHPIDGLAILLIRNKGILSPPAYDEKTSQGVLRQVRIIAASWGPKLRYRSTDPDPREVREVQQAARWFVDNSSKL